MTRLCDCCEGPHVLTPLAVANRPGLSHLRFRAGTHASLFETMQARLSASAYPQLDALKTREKSDYSIALLDSWATVGDVLTFYQERIANEGYLRTATERRSIVELARLIGYAPRLGVAASVYLAYGLEKDSAPVDIPKGARANSVPAPGEQMQAFETAEPLSARVEWNAIKPRLTEPQTLQSIKDRGLYLKGTATKLRPNDPLLIKNPEDSELKFLRILSVDADHDTDRTRVVLRLDPEGEKQRYAQKPALIAGIWGPLIRAPTLPPASAKKLTRDVTALYGASSDIVPQLLTHIQPELTASFYAAWKNLPPPVLQPIEAHALRIEARPFGHNAPLRLESVGGKEDRPVMAEWVIQNPWNVSSGIIVSVTDVAVRVAALPDAKGLSPEFHQSHELFMDNDYDIAPDSLIVIDKPDHPIIIKMATTIVHRSFAGYGLSGKSAQIKWSGDELNAWINFQRDNFSTVRATRVYAGSETLELADVPIADDVAGEEIELGGVFDGLQPGRWLIVEGERSDISAPGVRAAELVMLAAVEQRVRMVNGAPQAPQPGDTVHTFIKLAGTAQAQKGGTARGLAYSYKRSTVTIYANVVKATHGETRAEVLGSGNAAEAFQQFILKQPPLTYVSAPTDSGVESTLEARVNDVRWHQAANLAALGGSGRSFVTKTADDDKTTVIFGDGAHGLRLPTGLENIKAVYRNGIGKLGNAKAAQISLLGTRPLGVKDVINPIRASGGADKESRDSARKNAPLAVMALDRLVSTPDYADFARTFGGIGKAAAARDTDGQRQSVQVTIAGADDSPIELTSDVYRNLKDALHRFGDPFIAVQLAVRQRLALVIAARVKIDPDYLWDALEPKIRAAMLEAFSFENIELGEDLLLSTAIRTIQSVRGVVYVDIDTFDMISELEVAEGFTRNLAPNLKLNDRLKIRGDGKNFPAQLAYLTPDVPDTLILQELKS